MNVFKSFSIFSLLVFSLADLSFAKPSGNDLEALVNKTNHNSAFYRGEITLLINNELPATIERVSSKDEGAARFILNPRPALGRDAIITNNFSDSATERTNDASMVERIKSNSTPQPEVIVAERKKNVGASLTESGNPEGVFHKRLFPATYPVANKKPKAKAEKVPALTDKDGDGVEEVVLDGSKSKDKDGEIVSYSWSLNGEEIATGVNPTVELPVGTATILLTVTDDDGATATDEVAITINAAANVAPVADAGEDKTVTDEEGEGEEEVELDGSASTDADGEIVSYSWSIDDTEIATGEEAEVMLAVGVHTIKLTVTDDDGATATDILLVQVNNPANVAPVADAGEDKTVTDEEGEGEEEVELDGSASTDADGEIVSYSWSIDDTEIATGVNPTVELPVGTATILLTVTDDDGATATDILLVQVNNPANVAPVADAGEDKTLTLEDEEEELEVALDGSASTDEDGEIVSYSWSIAGEEIATGVNPTVELPVGTSTIVLTVTDDDGATATDEVAITINAAANVAPVADAGEDKTVTDEEGEGEEEVELDGSASTDADGEIVSYSWSIDDTEIATGVNPTVELPVGTATILLTVTDDDGATATDEVAITINELAILSVAVERNGTEGGPEGSFLISSTTTLNEPITFRFSLGGTAEEGEDYALPEGELVLPAGQTSLSVPVTVVDDNRVEGDETLVLNLDPVEVEGVVLDAAASSAEMIIIDNEECFTISSELQPASCSGTSDGAIDITIEGSSEDLIFSWSNGYEREDLEDVPAGTYQLEVTDQVSGCSLNREYVLQVSDQAPPVARGRNMDVQLGSNGQATLSAVSLNDGSSDNCEISTISLSQTTFTCADIGEQEVVLTVEDVNGNAASTSVTVTVEDKLAPVFAANQQFSISEDAATNSPVGTVEASDNCQTLSWAITEGNEENLFQINGSGEISTRAQLDYERQTRYDLTVRATAGGLQSTEVVAIKLQNVEEPGPDIGVVLDEYQSVNEDELYTFDIPTDAFEVPEGETLRYSLFGQADWLRFDENTLHLEGTPGNEDVGAERITVRATDSQGRYAEQHFRLEVINVNDAPHALNLSRNLIQENQPEGTVVGHVTTEDVDREDAHTYQFVSGEGSQHNAYFTLSNGDLISTRPLDYEVDSVLSIRLAVTDLAGASYEQIFRIKVGNEIDGSAFLPNLFSPNGDGMNDAFMLRSTHVESVNLRIYNRQGLLIYETRDVEEATQTGWDGTANGEPQPPGSYVWILEGTFNDGSPLLIEGKTKGSITLIR
jgi:gliding motility-associated-like protein